MAISEFADFLNQDITVEPFQGNDGYGEPIFGASVAYKARCVGKTKVVRDANGVERVSNQTVYVLSTQSFGAKDRITLPVNYSPQQPTIVSVGLYPDERGMHHSVIYLA